MELKYVAVVSINNDVIEYADDIIYDAVLTPREMDVVLIELLEKRIESLKKRIT